jgi:ethanolamine utilization microcompartment shell protein EutS
MNDDSSKVVQLPGTKRGPIETTPAGKIGLSYKIQIDANDTGIVVRLESEPFGAFIFVSLTPDEARQVASQLIAKSHEVDLGV